MDSQKKKWIYYLTLFNTCEITDTRVRAHWLARLTKKEYLAEQKAILENKLGKKLEVVEEKNVPRRKARKRSR